MCLFLFVLLITAVLSLVCLAIQFEMIFFPHHHCVRARDICLNNEIEEGQLLLLLPNKRLPYVNARSDPNLSTTTTTTTGIVGR